MPGMMAQQPSNVTTTVAPGANRQGWVFGLGLGLILVNFFFTSEGGDVLSALIPGHSPSSGQPHTNLVDTIGQGLMLLILVAIAGIDDTAGSAALLFVVALWLGWLLSHIGLVQQFLPVSSVQGPTGNSPQSPTLNNPNTKTN